MRGCSVDRTRFTDTTFRKANLTSVDLTTVIYNHVSFSSAILIGAQAKPFKEEDRVHLGEAVLIDINKKLPVAELVKKIKQWLDVNVPKKVIYLNLWKVLDNKTLKYQPQDKKIVLEELQKLFDKITEDDVKTFDMKLFHAGNCYLDIQKKLTKIEFQLAHKVKSSRKIFN